MAQASCACALAAAAGIVAGCGLVLLVVIGLLRTYAPATISHVRPLHFDYTQSQAVAVASLVTKSEHQTVPALPGSRVFPTAHQLQVSVKLRLPDTDRNKEIFQLTGELVTGDGRVAARSTRPVKLSYRSTLVHSIRQMFLLPLVLSGIRDESSVVSVKLFESYEEKEAHPVAYFRAYLSPSFNAKQLPELYDAQVTIRLRLGLLSHLLYWVRPGLLTSSLLGMVGAALLAGGTSALLGLVLCATFLYVVGRGPQPRRKQLPRSPSSDLLDASSDASLAACPKGVPLFDEDAASNNMDSPESLPDAYFRSESKSNTDHLD